jgi:hypothetical protein
MKKLSISVLLLAIVGCNNPSISQTSNSISGDCPEQPSVSLEPKDVKPITLTTSGTTQESGQVKSGKSLGYTFEAQAGQKLSYQTKDDICIWIFTQDLTLLEGVDLPKDGKYTVQVAALKGATTFNLAMSLGGLQAASNPSPVNPTSSPTSVPEPSVSSSSSSSGLSQNQAAQLVGNWLGSKSKIFAPPFNRQLVNQYTTGPLYRDITKPNGSINWLEKNNSRYDYKDARVTEVISFSDSGSQPSLTVRVYEDRTLYGSNGIDYNRSGSSTRKYTYFFTQENGNWKIYDYKRAE